MLIYEVEALTDGCFIYELIDPRTNAVRYVGSTRSAKIRYYTHNRGRVDTTAAWVAEVRDAGHHITMRVVSHVPISERWVAEQRHIDQHSDSDLLNQVPVTGIGQYKRKFTLAEIVTAIEMVRHIPAAAYYLQAEINRRTSSKTNPGRPKWTCVCGHLKLDHVDRGLCMCGCEKWQPKVKSKHVT